ncbi:MAG: hypothetical protein P8N02_12415 [Actinomycetota bacterium]|jgi:hypothetical protein|nr:hypothetical protein [Actinomycetota bacterium]
MIWWWRDRSLPGKAIVALAVAAVLTVVVSDAQPAETAGTPIEPIPVGALLDSADAIVTASAYDIGSPRNLFDGDENTIYRSASVNPAQIEPDFLAPVAVHTIRVYAEGNVWTNPATAMTIESADSLDDLTSATGSYRLLAPRTFVDDNVWFEVELAEPVRASVLRLTVERIPGDDFVHIGEWEVWGPSSGFTTPTGTAVDGADRLWVTSDSGASPLTVTDAEAIGCSTQRPTVPERVSWIRRRTSPTVMTGSW